VRRVQLPYTNNRVPRHHLTKTGQAHNSPQGPSYTPDLGTRPRCRLRTLAFRDPEYRCSWPELGLKVFVTVPAPGRTPPSLVLQKSTSWVDTRSRKTRRRRNLCIAVTNPVGVIRSGPSPMPSLIIKREVRPLPLSFSARESARPMDYTYVVMVSKGQTCRLIPPLCRCCTSKPLLSILRHAYNNIPQGNTGFTSASGSLTASQAEGRYLTQRDAVTP